MYVRPSFVRPSRGQVVQCEHLFLYSRTSSRLAVCCEVCVGESRVLRSRDGGAVIYELSSRWQQCVRARSAAPVCSHRFSRLFRGRDAVQSLITLCSATFVSFSWLKYHGYSIHCVLVWVCRCGMFVQRYRSICDSIELSFGACVGESTSTMLIHKGLLKYRNRRVSN